MPHSPLYSRLSRRAVLLRGSSLAAALALYAACRGGTPAPPTTLGRTIVRDAEGNLTYGPGEPYVVRTDLAQARTGRERRRRPILTFHHLSDFRILDEESPLRSEWADSCDPPVPSAFRPQETLSVQAAEALIAAANAHRVSPATGAPATFAIHTGNAADNAQYNELRWFLDLMDGRPVYPDSGAIGYQGVQTAPADPSYGDSLTLAQRAFQPEGLAYPWYAVLGNRDVLIQGNVPPTEATQRFVSGAQKLMALGPDALAEACSGSEALLGPGSSSTIFNDPETVIRGVGSDSNRRFLSRTDWIAEHFATNQAPGPPGHGFPAEAATSGLAYYTFERGGVSFIVLDTVNPGGFAAGSIDSAQLAWLEHELIARSSSYLDGAGQPVVTGNPDRLVVVVSHHPLDGMTNPFPDADGSARLPGASLDAVLHRFPNVILHLAGHDLAHRITARPDPAGPGHAYWEITTGSPLDVPLQGRLIDITDNGDGTMSIFSTVYDSLAPLNPGDAEDPTPDDGVNQRLLAALARQLAYGDPQADPAAAGLAPSDRNAEMVIQAPFDLSTLPTATPAARPNEPPID